MALENGGGGGDHRGERVAEIDSQHVSISTRRTYVNANARLFRWLLHEQNGLYAHCVNVETGKIILENVTPDIFKRFLASKLDDSQNGVSTLNGYRSALRMLFTEAGIPMSFDEELKQFFRGLKREVAQRRRNEGEVDGGDRGRKQREGKHPLPFEVYSELMGLFIAHSSDERCMWGHAYSVLSWNMMCRCNNTGAVHSTRMGWVGDCLTIFFAVTKCDQEGEKPKNPFHIYANPTAPEVCPILALSLFLMYFGVGSDGKLFPSGGQGGGKPDSPETRFATLWGDFLKTDEARAILARYGLKPGNNLKPSS